MKTITVYTLPNCPQCTQTKRWLDRKGPNYQAVDLSTDEQAEAAVKALGYQAAPVVLVSNGDTSDETHWYGFRPDMLTEFCTEAAAA